ncbi:dopamine receptor 2-like [Babylonia areolata]|uniref:dopamine receptor 2-like n=1 Tax=Babylonia areolata TaxID=304850 RepID=UPI003FD3DD5D
MVRPGETSTFPVSQPTDSASRDLGAWSSSTQLHPTNWSGSDVTDGVTRRRFDDTPTVPASGSPALRNLGVTLLANVQRQQHDSDGRGGNGSLDYSLEDGRGLAEVTWLSVENVTGFAGNVSGGNFTGEEDSAYELKHPVMGVMLALFSLVVIIGNVMVIVAVFKELYLRSVTNYFIVSLAIADVMVGGVVMPFAISREVTNEVWLFGQEWCDLWHSLDVLASTASILNLCVISLDRYWAITNPINYPSKMSNSKVCLLITMVWLCSAGISFPAIAWWKAVTPSDLPEHECLFTEDSGYLIISSLISFYIPTFIMMFVYAKIYRAALAQSEGIKAGSKITTNGLRGDDGELMTLRIHRGGLRVQEDHHLHHSHHSHTNGGGGGGCSNTQQLQQYERSTSDSDGESPCHSTRVHVSNGNSAGGTPRPAKHITKRLRHFAISKKLTKLAREQKAAKTLGIVVGVFIICWLPFFVTNVLVGLCKENCITNPDILFPVVTWLGYINSGMNPVIYALSMRDFRRAFSKMIFCCCPRYRYEQTQKTYYNHSSVSTSSFTAVTADKCVTLKI